MPLFFLSFSFEAFEFNKGYLLFILVSVGLIAWLGQMIFQDKKIKFRRTPLDFYVLGFLVIMIFSALLSQDKITSLLGFYGRFWPSLIGILSLGGFYFLITNNVTTPLKRADQNAEKTLKSATNQRSNQRQISVNSLIKLFLWSSFFVALTAYFSLFGIWAKMERIIPGNWQFSQVMKTQTFSSIGGSLEQLAIFLAFISVLIIGLLAFRKRSKGLYLLLFASLGLLAFIDFWASWLIIFLTLLCFLGFAFWKRIFKENVNRLSLSIFFLLICLIFILFNPLQNLLPQNSNLSNLPKEVLLSQDTIWSINWQALKEHPVLGSGLGNFSYAFSKFKPESFLQTNLWQIRFDRAGSHMAEIIGTTGILGTLSYFLLLAMFLMISWVIIATKKLTGGYPLQIPLFLALVALLIGQFVFYQNMVLGFSFWLLLALSVVSWQRESKCREYAFKDFPEVGLIFSVVFWVILIGFAFLCFNLGKYYLADVHYRSYLQEPNKIEVLEKAAKLADKRTTYHIVLARAYLLKFGAEAAQPSPDNQVIGNMVALAVQEGKTAAGLSPNRVSSQETLGVIYRDIRGVAQGALGWGIKSFEKAAELEPKNPVLLTELGKLKLSENKIEEAKSLFVRALELMPEYIDANLQMSLIDESQERSEQAVERLETLVQLYPFSSEVLFQLGRLYFNSGKIDEAIDLFQQIIKFAPNHANAHYSLGLAYEKKGQKDAALEEFEKVLKLNPGNEDIMKKIEQLKE